MSAVGVTVVLIGIGSACFTRAGVRGDSGGTRDSRHGVRVGTPVAQKSSPNCEAMLSHQRIAASTRNTQPNAPNTRLTTQNERFFVSAEIAAMAIAIWNMVTPRANTSCL